MDKAPGMKVQEGGFDEAAILDLLARISHRTWMRQRSRDKNEDIDSLDPNVSDGDQTRAVDAWSELKKFIGAGLTREQTINLLAAKSHQRWIKDKEALRLKNDEPAERLDPAPNDHDRERAEDMIQALEAHQILKFAA